MSLMMVKDEVPETLDTNFIFSLVTVGDDPIAGYIN
jgi:hypothetical protein